MVDTQTVLINLAEVIKVVDEVQTKLSRPQNQFLKWAGEKLRELRLETDIVFRYETHHEIRVKFRFGK